MIAAAIQSLFADKLIHDDRDPIHIFTIPGLDGDYALYAPKPGLWNQLALSVLIQLVFQEMFAILVYRTIVQPRQRQQQQKEKGGSSSSSTTTSWNLYLLGYGAYIPCILYIPFALLRWLQVHNKVLKLAFSTLATIVGFRTIEAMHGTSPPVVESSLGTYMVYYSSVSHFDWNPQTIQRRPITRMELMMAIFRVAYFFTAVSLWLSFMMHVQFQPMSNSTVPLDSFRLGWDLISIEHLMNTYCLALLTYFLLATGFEITTLGEQVKGFATLSIFHNPLWSSRSIREFWAEKWDLMIQRVLKHGAFLPARQVFLSTQTTADDKNKKSNDNSSSNKQFANIMATAVTFLASGLLHEYAWMVIFLQYDTDDQDIASSNKNCGGICYSPLPLKVTLFFLYNSLILTLEHYYGHHYLRWFDSWPAVFVSTLLVLTALPLSHWFTGDWVVGGYFSDFAIGLWHIKKLES